MSGLHLEFVVGVWFACLVCMVVGVWFAGVWFALQWWVSGLHLVVGVWFAWFALLANLWWEFVVGVWFAVCSVQHGLQVCSGLLVLLFARLSLLLN